MRSAPLAGAETAALEDELDAEVFPGQVRRIALGEDLELLAAAAERALGVRDLLFQRAVDGVVLEEMRQRFGIGDVVHRDEVEPAFVETCPKHVPTDAAEAIDADTHCHGVPPRG